LLKILANESPIKSERFYANNGAEEERLIDDGGFELEYQYSSQAAPIGLLIDLAAGQLGESGFVTMKKIGMLDDGTEHYKFALTPSGRSFVKSGGTFQYHGMDL
jgi:hypothetical protein